MENKTSFLYDINLPDEIEDIRGKVPEVMTAEAARARFLLTKEALPKEITVLDPLDSAAYASRAGLEVFVSPDGDDAAAGTEDAPIATLSEALSRVAGKGGAAITLRGGKYAVSEPLTVGEEHSGTPGHPLIIRSYPGERATVTGNTPLSTERGKWQLADPATDPVAARLPKAVQGKVIATRLADHGLTSDDIPPIVWKNVGPPSLFVDGEEYTLARYPNKDTTIFERLFFTHVYDSGTCTVRDGSGLYWPWVERANREFGGDIKHTVGWQIRLLNNYDNFEHVRGSYRPDPTADERAAFVSSWVNTGNIWLYGSLFSGWEFGNYNLADVTEGKDYSHYAEEDTEEKTPLLGAFVPDENGPCTYRGERGYFSLKSKHYNHWGCMPSGNSPAGVNTYYLYNAIEALDEPGEWFLDRETDILYLYPKDDSFFGSDLSFSSKKENAPLILSSLSHAILDGIEVDGTGEVGIRLNSCLDLVLQRVKVRNTKAENLYVKDCYRTAIIYSDFSQAGTVLIHFDNSDAHFNQRPTKNLLQNCFFHDPKPMRQHAMVFSGCRTVVSHNYFRNTCVDNTGASECIFEYNRFEGGSADVVDGGMYYASGHTVRNNHIRYNLFHMFNQTHQGMYFDTMCGGNYCYCNIVSTLGSKSNRHRGWYCSSGLGSVSFSNLFILRNPWEIKEANPHGGDEGDSDSFEPGDNINLSGLFYRYFDNEHSSPTARTYDLNKEQANAPYGADYGPAAEGLILYQNEAGHWWEGMMHGELDYYTKVHDPMIFTRTDPAYINHMRGTAIVLDALDNSDYRVRYFYVPARLSGKSFTSSAAPAGTPVVIPTYTYLGDDYEPITVSSHTVTVPESGSITLTYEEIAAMERLRRACAYNVVENNIVVGGTPLCDENLKVLADIDPLYMLCDDLDSEWYEDTDGVWKRRATYGYVSTLHGREKNYFSAKHEHVIADARGYDYTIKGESLGELSATVDPSAIEELRAFDYTQTGPTYPFDYEALGPVQV